MSPENKQRLARVVGEVWRAALAPGAAKNDAAKMQAVTYAGTMLEGVVEAEVTRILDAREAG